MNEERDSSEADERTVGKTEASASKSPSITVWTVTSVIISHRTNLF